MSWQNSTAYGLEGRRPVDWRERAACRDADPDTFFPTAKGNSDIYQRQVAKAKSYCRGCDVIEQCLTFALHPVQRDGIWAGKTPEELGRERKRRDERARRARQREQVAA